jgi:hypothetical protein
MAKAYTEARQQHGDSELLDELVSSRPKVDRTRAHSIEELQSHHLGRLQQAVATLRQKATPEEVEEFREFVRRLAERVAEAHKEGGETVSEPERAVLDQIEAALGS